MRYLTGVGIRRARLDSTRIPIRRELPIEPRLLRKLRALHMPTQEALEQIREHHRLDARRRARAAQGVERGRSPRERAEVEVALVAREPRDDGGRGDPMNDRRGVLRRACAREPGLGRGEVDARGNRAARRHRFCSRRARQRRACTLRRRARAVRACARRGSRPRAAERSRSDRSGGGTCPLRPGARTATPASDARSRLPRSRRHRPSSRSACRSTARASSDQIVPHCASVLVTVAGAMTVST